MPPTAATTQPRPAILALPARAGAARYQRRTPRFAWMAHVAGAIAAGVILALGLTVFWTPDGAKPEPRALALQEDVEIMEVQMVDPDYTVVLVVGDATDVAAIWVVPTDEEDG